MTNYLKAVVAALGALAMTITAAVSDKAVSFDEANGIIIAAIAVATALGVYAAPNRPKL